MRLHAKAVEDRIRGLFASGPPNGWLRGWDRDRGFNEFVQVVTPHEATNNTSFDYAFCNQFDVRVELEDKQHAVLTVLTSFVADVFSTHWTVYEPDGRSGGVVEGVIEGRELRTAVEGWLRERGFAELPDDLGAMNLNGIELELAGDENVTVEKCLFRDFEG